MKNKGKKANIDGMLEQALRKVKYPGFDMDIVSLDLVTQAEVIGGKAVVRLKTLNAPAAVREQMENAIAAALAGLPGIKELDVELPEAPPPPEKKEHAGPHAIEGVAAVVPVASGKGGVGKSTVAVNLALGLKELGLKVGLLDLDLYGPSIPMMLGLMGVQPQAEGEKLAPVDAQGIKVMSIGFLMPSEKALIWRGPLIIKAVRQLFHEVAWGTLDVLILDLPPGTGDVQISMAQEVPVTGAVVVTTPQDVATIDAIKAVDMFKAVKAPVLGIVENMSYFVCDGCGKRHEIFGHGKVEPLCQRLGVDYLGELPLDPAVRKLSDEGKAAVGSHTAAAAAYQSLAKKVAAKLSAAARPAKVH